MNSLMKELELRWTAMFTALAAGDDLPPTRRLRTEGLMEAVVLVDAASAQEVDEAMDGCYLQAFGKTIAGDFGEDWRAFYPFPQIPAMARRAPVYPSTRD